MLKPIEPSVEWFYFRKKTTFARVCIGAEDRAGICGGRVTYIVFIERPRSAMLAV